MGILDIFNRKPSPEKFARLMMEAAAKDSQCPPMRFDPENFRILIGAGSTRFVNLHNLYSEYCEKPPQERPAAVQRYLDIFSDRALPATFDEASNNLMPVIRPRGMGEYLRLNQLLSDSGDAGFEASSPLSADAVVMVAYDTEHSMTMLSSTQLEEWGVPFDTALACALDNLRDATVDKFEQYSPGVFFGDWNDAYDSSRILLPDLVYRVGTGDPVAMIPNRGRLLVTSGHNRQGMLDMLELAQQCAEQEERPVSALMYRFSGGRAEEFVPEDADVARGLEDLKRFYRCDDYAQQKAMLDQVHEKDGIDIFVASSLLLREQDTGTLYSLCTWTKGADSLLPQTDRVTLMILDDDAKAVDQLTASWSDVWRIAGDLMQPQHEGYPVRFRVTSFPSDDQLQMLRTGATFD